MEPGIAWRGRHPEIPYAIYEIAAIPTDAPIDHVGDTHLLVVCVSVNVATVLDREFSARCDRCLYRRACDYGQLPGRTADQVASYMIAGLMHFLLSTPNPHTVPGMYDLLEDSPDWNPVSPWEAEHRALYRKLVAVCLRGWRF
jgi:hypothetical protein